MCRARSGRLSFLILWLSPQTRAFTKGSHLGPAAPKAPALFSNKRFCRRYGEAGNTDPSQWTRTWDTDLELTQTWSSPRAVHYLCRARKGLALCCLSCRDSMWPWTDCRCGRGLTVDRAAVHGLIESRPLRKQSEAVHGHSRFCDCQNLLSRSRHGRRRRRYMTRDSRF
jgi:hypothetical protein